MTRLDSGETMFQFEEREGEKEGKNCMSGAAVFRKKGEENRGGIFS